MMSNSPLVSYTRISPNKSKGRVHSTHNPKGVIDKITIHHVAGKISLETLGAIFAPSSRQASSNYGVGNDGKVGMYCEEKDRSWCTSSAANDYRAITIEVVNSATGGTWPVSDKALQGTIDLCVDICKRNNIKKLNYTGDKTGNLTMHKWFANTNCPGPYLESKFPYIAAEVNKRLGAATTPSKPAPVPTPQTGDLLYGQVLRRNNKGSAVKSLQADLAKLGYSVGPAGIDGSFGPTTETAVKNFQRANRLEVDGIAGPATQAKIKALLKSAEYQVKVTAAALNYRSGPGTNYKVSGTIRDKGTYTIVETKGDWGKLKSGAGWIHLGYTQKTGGAAPVKPQVKTIQAGSKVQVKANAKTYSTGQTIPGWVKKNTYVVGRVDKAKALLQGINSWVDTKDLDLK